MALSAAQIQQIYLAVLQRSASTADANAWSTATNGTLTDAQVIADIVSSPEAVEYVDPIVRLYQAAFGRIPDEAGLKGWENSFKSGALSELQIVSDFISSAEFTARYGATNPNGAPTSAFVQLLYQNVLGRQGSQSEVSGWVNSGQTDAEIMLGFVNSAEFISDTNSAVNTFLTNAAIYNLSPADPSLPAVTSSPYSGSLLASKYVLTPGADHASANIFYGDLTPYNINGVGPTLNSDDVLTGTGNNSQLIVTDGYASGLDAIPAGISITNIQNIILNTNGNAGNGGAAWNLSHPLIS